jgi:hypothetical protein
MMQQSQEYPPKPKHVNITSKIGNESDQVDGGGL